jgi:hypothetical protein
MRLSIRSKLYVFSAVAMLALAAMGALGLAAGYLADVQLHRLRHDHGLALARLSQGEATMRASPPAWPMLTAIDNRFAGNSLNCRVLLVPTTSKNQKHPKYQLFHNVQRLAERA